MINDDDRVTIRSVAWAEIFPWLVIFRVFRLAIGFRVLVLSSVGLLLTLCGWAVIGWIFAGEEGWEPGWLTPAAGNPWTVLTGAVPDLPDLAVGMGENAGRLPAPMPAHWQPADPFFGSWAVLTRPAWEVFTNQKLSISGLTALVLCGLLGLAVWAFFGAAITRIAAVQLACDERISWAAALRHACTKWPSYFAAPLFPVIGILLAALPVAVLGGLVWLLGNWGILLVALAWPLLLLAGMVMAVLLLGLVLGWPLMWGTISSEGTDSFDALSRSYNFTFLRPLRYLFYAVVAAVIGYLGWWLVSYFAAGVVWLTYWAASWGATGETVKTIRLGSEGLEGVGSTGAAIIRFWAGCVKILADGFFYAYFWVAAAAIYLLLRHDVDATEMDEVYLDEDASERPAELPPIHTDEAGAPAISESAPQATADEPGDGSGATPKAEG